MVTDSVLSSTCSHRIVAYFDVDCFYAQVEVLKRPHLKGRPVGVTQKFLVVTCNYEARQQGVPKMASIQAAKERCPDLVLFNGEDLTPYRTASKSIMVVLGRFGVLERQGLDEAALDITMEVMKRSVSPPICEAFSGHVLGQKGPDENLLEVSASLGGDGSSSDYHLMVGSQLVAKIRAAVEKETGFRCSSGIATNKMLAKLVSSINKPNKQTCILESGVPGFLMPLHVRKLPGVGHQMETVLKDMGITTVADLQQSTLEQLSTKFGNRIGMLLHDNCRGVDKSLVKDKGPPKSLSVEDSFQPCTSLKQAEEIIRSLAPDLISRLDEDKEEYSRRPKGFTVKWRYPGNWAFRSTSAPMPMEVLSTCVPLEQRLQTLVEIAMKLLSQSLGRQSLSIVVLNIGATSFTCSANGSPGASHDIRSFLSNPWHSTKRKLPKVISKHEARVNREESEKGSAKARCGEPVFEYFENNGVGDNHGKVQTHGHKIMEEEDSDEDEVASDLSNFCSCIEQPVVEQRLPYKNHETSTQPSASGTSIPYLTVGSFSKKELPFKASGYSLGISCGMTDVATDDPLETLVARAEKSLAAPKDLFQKRFGDLKKNPCKKMVDSTTVQDDPLETLVARSEKSLAAPKDRFQKRFGDLQKDPCKKMVDSTTVQDDLGSICGVCGQKVEGDSQSQQEHDDYHYALNLHTQEQSFMLNPSLSPANMARSEHKASKQPLPRHKKTKTGNERARTRNSTLDCFVYRFEG